MCWPRPSSVQRCAGEDDDDGSRASEEIQTQSGNTDLRSETCLERDLTLLFKRSGLIFFMFLKKKPLMLSKAAFI